MTTTPYGWPTSPNPATFGGLDNREVPGAPGVHLAPGIRSGDAADVAFHFAGQFHAHVEPLQPWPHCSGFAYRPNTNNHAVLSEHAGASFDLNSDKHPNGRRGTFTPEQVGVLRAILAGYDGLIVWGGDFHGTDDEMHFEIRHDLPRLAALVARLRGAPAPAPTPAPAPAPANEVGPGPHHGNTARHAPAELPPTTEHQPGPPPGSDAAGHASAFRAAYGDEGPNIGHLQRELNRIFPDYSGLDVDDIYGGETAAVLEEFAHRAATDPAFSLERRSHLTAADGYNVGDDLAAALVHYGADL
jgi:hypothetical protein